MNPWIVAKFGGSSVRDGNAMLRCSHIIENNSQIKVGIISATHNTTNQLEMVASTALNGDEEMLAKVISELEVKHNNIAKELFSSNDLYQDLNVLFQELKVISQKILQDKLCSPILMDQLYSLGERMSSMIFADLLKLRIPKCKIVYLDARKIIITNSEYRHAEPQIELIAQAVNLELMPLIVDEKTIVITQGFIGSDRLGNTTTLGREGSDYSAALIGEAIHASLIQIWTDVDGIASSDPRIVSSTKYIDFLTYEEATALATLGAKVLFPRTLAPAQRKNIPVFVGSSLNPTAKGTIIHELHDQSFKLKAVTAQTIDSENYLSFIGSHLEKNENLISQLSTELLKIHPSFIFHDYTSHAITFKYSVISIKDVLNGAHQLLSSL